MASSTVGTSAASGFGSGPPSSPSSRPGRNRCSVCSKGFDRKDTLNRHMHVHDRNRPLPMSRKKACGPCFKSKIKCLGEQPACSSCEKRRLKCVYDAPRSSNGHRPVPDVSRARARQVSLDFGAERTSNNLFPANDVGLLSPSSGGDHTFDPGISLHENLQVDPTMHVPAFHDPLQQVGYMTDFSRVFLDSSLFNNFEDTNLDSNLDWIFSNSLDDVFPSLPGSPRNGRVTDVRLPDQVQALPGRQTFNPHVDEDEVQDSDTVEALPSLPEPTPRDRCDEDDPWPMEWHSSAVQRLVLPTLGESDDDYMMQAAYYPTTRMTDSMRRTLQENVRLPLERVPWKTVSLANFPSKEKLDHCIDLYFAHFDRMLPIIHRSTFDPGKFPLVTLTMACIGACYTEFEGARAFASALSELNRRLLLFMAEHDPRFVRTDYYVTAQLLQGTHGFCSGSKRLFECSESWRSSLVNNTKCMGLFHYRSPRMAEDIPLEERWQMWINQEKFRRLGWAVYEYDSSVSYLHNTRPFISVADINMDLPSSSEHWEADSPQAWAALHPWTEAVPKTLKFRPTIRSLFDGKGKAINKIKDDRHRSLIILTFMRMLWSLKEIEGSPINDLVRETSHLKEGRKNLLEVLDQFLQSPAASSPMYTRKALANVVHRIQIVHMSHLYGAGDLMDWLYPLLRIGRQEAENARSRMMQWAAQSPARVREVTYHAAQTLSIIRQYPYNLPLEAFNAFHAGVVLWCMAEVLPQDGYVHQGRGMRIDQLVDQDDEGANAYIETWIREGGSQVVSLYGIPTLCARGKQQVLEQTADVLKGMRVWGIAQNFLKVILELMRVEEGGDRVRNM